MNVLKEEFYIPGSHCLESLLSVMQISNCNLSCHSGRL